ncbi:MAG: 16S rRNA (adenine(1518)-N(6)/adenine(1519)-N(6))-dimethyltransferase [Gammaproteobacteria bacterium]|nr:MAG: 16S rRNA (adenine(1518)-N(6)/adenine(1519)-N(6))-dimethyltransferase [Gammaproteobacteria bacterium]
MKTIRNYHYQARKRFGQNFLIDEMIINKIISLISVKEDDNLIEIGGGMGALSLPLSKKLNNFTIIELDRDLIAILKNNTNFDKGNINIINEDVLKVDFNQFNNNLRLVGNLPYNISTPLLLKTIDCVDKIQDVHFMLQKEVALRICANPNNKIYGRLSVLMAYYYHRQVILEVPFTSFSPQPKVQSAIVRLVPRQIKNKVLNLSNFHKIIKLSFAMRRKTLYNNLKTIFNVQQLEKTGINGQRRAETLSVDEFITLSNFYEQQ